MEITPKLANIVVLGNFNPAILTSNFLQNTCQISLQNPQKDLSTPFESFVTYEKISFIASLERFEVAERDPIDFKKTQIDAYSNSYLGKLVHTPLIACGMNINVDIKNLNIKNLEKYFIEDHSLLSKLFKNDEFIVGNNVRVAQGKEEAIQFTITYLVRSPDILVNVQIKLIPDKVYNLNFNYEIRKKNDFNIILDNYQERIKDFYNFIQAIG